MARLCVIATPFAATLVILIKAAQDLIPTVSRVVGS